MANTDNLEIVLPEELILDNIPIIRQALVDIDAAVAGAASVDVAAGHVTLVRDEYLCALLALTGAPGAARNVLFPDDLTGFRVVVNNTTGGQAITAKTVSGTGVIIPAGVPVLLNLDGTNIAAAGTSGNTAYAPVIRDGSGRARFSDPSHASDAATKGSVDTAIASLAAGAASSTDNAIARYDSTTGKILQNSLAFIDDAGALIMPEMSAPSTPASGTVVVYPKSDGKVYRKDDTGAETELGGGGALPADFISGLNIEWTSTTSITVKKGSAYVESAAAVVTLAADSTVSPTLAASGWVYVYLKSDGTIQTSTTAPTTPYNAFARSKTGDTAQRYLGAIKTNGSSLIINFQMLKNGMVFYRDQPFIAPCRILTNGTATTETSVDASGAIPIGARAGILRFLNGHASLNCFFGTSEDNIAVPGSNGIQAAGPNQSFTTIMPLDINQDFTYAYASSPGGNGIYVDTYGYILDR